MGRLQRYQKLCVSWPPLFPASETTDTLVFTFPSNHTIDLRFRKNGEHRGTLDWGFAGRVVIEGSKITFVHFVDSRNPTDPLSVQDSGHFSILPNGDELETGEMLNPATGRVMAYEEIWRKLPLLDTAVDAICLESVGGDGKAFIGQIGQRFQGIFVQGESVTAVRRIYREGIWEDLYKVGKHLEELPCFNNAEDDWKPGQEVEFQKRVWIVRDCSRHH